MSKRGKCEECGGNLGDAFYVDLGSYSLPLVCTKCAQRESARRKEKK